MDHTTTIKEERLTPRTLDPPRDRTHRDRGRASAMAQRPESGHLFDPARADDLPVGVNLSWRLQVLIASGRLAPKDRLPGVREFAAGAGVNVNTARSVYRRLENQGLAVSQQGFGTFVAPYITVAPTLERFAAQVATDAIVQGIHPHPPPASGSGRMRFPPTALRRTGPRERYPHKGHALAPRSTRAVLRAQITRLEAKLAPHPETPASSGPGGQFAAHPRIVNIGELEAIRDDLVARLKRAQADAKRRDERQSATRRWREEAISEPSAHRWESVSSEDLGEPGCGRLEVRPVWGPVGVLMNWWRVKMSSGCP
jgi:DNA-binding transcriptional regulator YhcF (GntR family)